MHAAAGRRKAADRILQVCRHEAAEWREYMKFSNGCWMNKEGTEVFSPAEVYFYKAGGEAC